MNVDVDDCLLLFLGTMKTMSSNTCTTCLNFFRLVSRFIASQLQQSSDPSAIRIEEKQGFHPEHSAIVSISSITSISTTKRLILVLVRLRPISACLTEMLFDSMMDTKRFTERNDLFNHCGERRITSCCSVDPHSIM